MNNNIEGLKVFFFFFFSNYASGLVIMSRFKKPSLHIL